MAFEKYVTQLKDKDNVVYGVMDEECRNEAGSLKSAKAPVIEVSDSVSEAVKSFSDGADNLPMAVTVGIEPVQDLHGQENPYPAGGGKNLVPMTIQNLKSLNTGGTWSGETYTQNGVSFTIVKDSADNVIGVKATGTASSNTFFYLGRKNFGLVVEAGVEYILNGCPSGSLDNNFRLQITDGSTATYTDKGSGATFTLDSTFIEGSYYTAIRIASGYACPSAGIIFAPMIRLSSVSDATFAPYSNICPISGWTGANVSRTGKNLFDKTATDTENGYIGNSYLKNDGVTAGDSDCNVSEYISVKPSTEYILQSITGGSLSVCFYNHNKEFVSGIKYNVTWGTESNKTFTTPDNAFFIRFSIAKMYLDKTMLLIGSETAAYEPYHGTTLPISWQSTAGTVYGGTLTIDKDGTGTLVVDRKRIVMDGVNVVVNGSYDDNAHKMPALTLSSADYFKTGTDKWFISDTLLGVTTTLQLESTRNSLGLASNLIVFHIGDIIGIDGSHGYSSVEQLLTAANSFFQQNNVAVVYRLATPVTYNLTAEQVGQIKSLLGVNNIWASTGNIKAVEYPADTKLYVDRKAAETRKLVELIITANREDSMKATKAYASGDLLIVNGTLYKASASIANGATLTVGTNVTATTVASELAALA